MKDVKDECLKCLNAEIKYDCFAKALVVEQKLSEC